MPDTQKRPRGKWSDEGVPHKGWRCIDVERLDERAICQMCESAEIRYAHHMEHPSYTMELVVGCQCAENMEEDYTAPRVREARLRTAAASRRTWLSRHWRISNRGNSFLKTRDGFHVVVWQNHDASWGDKVTDHQVGQEITSKYRDESERAVQVATFDALQVMKSLRDKGTVNLRL